MSIKKERKMGRIGKEVRKKLTVFGACVIVMLSGSLCAGKPGHTVTAAVHTTGYTAAAKDYSCGEKKLLSSKGQKADRKKRAADALIKAWNSVSASCDLSAYQLTPDELSEIYKETRDRYPKFFYVRGGYSYYNIREGAARRVLSVEIKYSQKDKEKVKSMKKAYNKAVSAIKKKADPSWSDLEKALYIHEYLARNCAYDEDYRYYTAYDAIVRKKAVCEGYSLAFKELAQQLGLSCEIVRSTDLDHSWNLVKINQNYYHVDVTWDDPTKDQIGRVQHYYFLKSTRYFKFIDGDHNAEDWKISGGVSAKAASNTKYDDYFWDIVETGFDYADGFWYGFDGEESICQYSCDGEELAWEEDMITISDVWETEDGTYTDKFTGTGIYQGILYYSGESAIYRLDPQTGESESIFQLPQAEERSIYGMNVTETGAIRYILSDKPGGQQKISKISLSGI